MLTGKASVYIDGNKSGENWMRPNDTEDGVVQDENDDKNSKDEKRDNYNDDDDYDVEDEDEDEDEDYDHHIDEVEKVMQRKKLAEIKTQIIAERRELDRIQYGKFIVQYESGQSFGEIALMSTDSIRNATIIADEEVDLLVVTRELFNRAFKANQKLEFEERQVFIERSGIFNWWQPRFRRLLQMSLRKELFKYDSRIVEQGQAIVGLHFILKGTICVHVQPSKHARQFPRFFQTHVNPEEALRSNSIGPSQQQLAIQVRRQHGYCAAEKRHFYKNSELLYMDEGDIIGDIELVAGFDEYVCTYVVTSEVVETLILDTHNIERLFQRRNQRSIQLLSDIVLKKMKVRTSNKNQRIPLFEGLKNYLVKRFESLNFRFKEKKKQTDEEKELTHLIHLFLLNKAPLIDNCIPNGIFHRMQTHKNAEMWQRRFKNRQQCNDYQLYNECESIAQSQKRFQPRTRRQLIQNTPNKHHALLTSSPIGECSDNTSQKIPQPTKHADESCEYSASYYNQDVKFPERQYKPRIFSAPSHSQANSYSAIKRKPQYFDFETSDEKLQSVETRLTNFLQRFEGVRNTNNDVKHLQRYNIQSQKIPLPGGTVLVYRKLRSTQEKQTRIHMLPRNAFSVLQSFKAMQLNFDNNNDEKKSELVPL